MKDAASELRLDPAIFEQIKELARARPGLLSSLVRNFDLQTSRLLNEAQQAISQRDLEVLKSGFHNLKGSAVSLGARRLSQMASAMEEACAEEATPESELRSLVQWISTEFAEVRLVLTREAACTAP